MNIVEATKSYEAWLGEAVPLVPRDIKRKHKAMAQSGFEFLRATYYRWAQRFPELCPALAAAPALAIVGDLHLENFGTWRDAEGRLCWGVNDFDEAHRGPYANDLVRLAASVLVAVADKSLYVGTRRAAAEILAGYEEAMAAKVPRPFVLEEDNVELRDIAMSDARSPVKFWKKIGHDKNAEPPEAVKALLLKHLPAGEGEAIFKRRIAGTGSLGLPRFAALRTVDGSAVGREAKARAPSAYAWARGKPHDPSLAPLLAARAMRPSDPFLVIGEHWTLRRLAPHCETIELSVIADAGERRDVLHAMGRETANVHRGTRGVRARIRAHLDAQKSGWLHDAASRMADATLKDWKVWKKRD